MSDYETSEAQRYLREQKTLSSVGCDAWIQTACQRIEHMGLVKAARDVQTTPYNVENYRSAAPDALWVNMRGWVYAAVFAEEDNPNKDRFIKIGYSKNPEGQRVAQLSKTWGDLEIQWVWPDQIFSEREIHEALQSYRVPTTVMQSGDGHTEWFLRYSIVDQICGAFHYSWNCKWDKIEENGPWTLRTFGTDEVAPVGAHVPVLGARSLREEEEMKLLPPADDLPF